LLVIREQVRIATSASGHTRILNLRVGPGDAGRIIGRQGRTINAIRTILNAAAAKEKQRVILEIVDNDEHPARSTPRLRTIRVEHHRVAAL